MSFNANLDEAIQTLGNVDFGNIYLRRDGSAFQCTIWYDRLWQWFKDCIGGDSRINKISDVFEQAAAQYFAQRSAPVTANRTVGIKTETVTAAKLRMEFLRGCIQARQESFNVYASENVRILSNLYNEIRELPLLENEPELGNVPVIEEEEAPVLGGEDVPAEEPVIPNPAPEIIIAPEDPVLGEEVVPADELIANLDPVPEEIILLPPANPDAPRNIGLENDGIREEKEHDGE